MNITSTPLIPLYTKKQCDPPMKRIAISKQSLHRDVATFGAKSTGVSVTPLINDQTVLKSKAFKTFCQTTEKALGEVLSSFPPLIQEKLNKTLKFYVYTTDSDTPDPLLPAVNAIDEACMGSYFNYCKRIGKMDPSVSNAEHLTTMRNKLKLAFKERPACTISRKGIFLDYAHYKEVAQTDTRYFKSVLRHEIGHAISNLTQDWDKDNEGLKEHPEFVKAVESDWQDIKAENKVNLMDAFVSMAHPEKNLINVLPVEGDKHRGYSEVFAEVVAAQYGGSFYHNPEELLELFPKTRQFLEKRLLSLLEEEAPAA